MLHDHDVSKGVSVLNLACAQLDTVLIIVDWSNIIAFNCHSFAQSSYSCLLFRWNYEYFETTGAGETREIQSRR
jgi:hypothetical protein